MDDHRRSAEERLYAERSDRMAAESRRLSLQAAEVADQVAAVERHVSAVHDVLAASNPTDPRFAAKADHARRSAESAEAFAIIERKVAATDHPADARELFERYQKPAPAADR
ncbi:MAG: hypothetical protein H0V10_15100 [Geodermatophilaceae bacterium]|nr:hypothetical protein [Geodermatophilaceae bacterium]